MLLMNGKLLDYRYVRAIELGRVIPFVRMLQRHLLEVFHLGLVLVASIAATEVASHAWRIGLEQWQACLAEL